MPNSNRAFCFRNCAKTFSLIVQIWHFRLKKRCQNEFFRGFSMSFSIQKFIQKGCCQHKSDDWILIIIAFIIKIRDSEPRNSAKMNFLGIHYKKRSYLTRAENWRFHTYYQNENKFLSAFGQENFFCFPITRVKSSIFFMHELAT